MALVFEPADEAFLLRQIKLGEVIPILGAGASRSSKNKSGESIKLSLELAEVFAHEAGLEYAGESLKDVLAAINGENILSKLSQIKILEKEYKGTAPSPELEDIFKYTWKRIYTWNIDDTIDNTVERKQQIVRPYNGLVDKAVDFETERVLHVVYLHGQVVKPDSGFILTEADYLRWINSSNHYWYARLGQDYIASCPLIIGSSMDEPILASELERAARQENSNLGRAFLITPDDLSTIKRRALRSKGIVHVRGFLEDFIGWLKQSIPQEVDPKSVIGNKSSYSDDSLKKINKTDVEVAHYLRPIRPNEIRENYSRLSGTVKSQTARQFLNGFGPNWTIASSDIPVRLHAEGALRAAIKSAMKSSEHMFIATGQSGSGKTTAVMQSLISIVDEDPEIPLYELSPDIKSPRRAFALLKKLHEGPCIVSVKDIFVFGDMFADDLDELVGTQIFVVSTARSGEWKGHLVRHLGERAVIHEFSRFNSHDFDPIIDRLIKYVPSPSFRKLSVEDKRKKLRSSKNQLLIVLREITESQNFSDVITNEYVALPDDEARILFLIIGIATIARTGISPEMSRDVYNALSTSRPYEAGLDVLSGIVSLAENGRLYARHELYVRHILERVAKFEEIKTVITEILRTYIKYNIPIVKSVKRSDATLFRFVLNHNFIQEHERRSRSEGAGRAIFEEFDVAFQLDGHYWLQYGLYLAGLGDLKQARGMLRKSIDAYPSNAFAVHAFADITLRIATQSSTYDVETRNSVDQAVAVLKEQDSKSYDDIDQYPIVTLSLGHISVLIKHGLREEARKIAPQYFERLKQIDKSVEVAAVKNAKDKIFRFVTLDEWQDIRLWQGDRKRSRNRNRRKAAGEREKRDKE